MANAQPLDDKEDELAVADDHKRAVVDSENEDPLIVQEKDSDASREVSEPDPKHLSGDELTDENVVEAAEWEEGVEKDDKKDDEEDLDSAGFHIVEE